MLQGLTSHPSHRWDNYTKKIIGCMYKCRKLWCKYSTYNNYNYAYVCKHNFSS